MSREDPQFKLRMSAELRAQAENAAKSAGRSLNAELVNRIEASFLSEKEVGSLISASKAKELSLLARKEVSNQVRGRSIEAINRSIRLGHSEAIVNLDDLHLDTGMPEDFLESMFKSVVDELSEAGYKVKLDDLSLMLIEF